MNLIAVQRCLLVERKLLNDINLPRFAIIFVHFLSTIDDKALIETSSITELFSVQSYDVAMKFSNEKAQLDH